MTIDSVVIDYSLCILRKLYITCSQRLHLTSKSRRLRTGMSVSCLGLVRLCFTHQYNYREPVRPITSTEPDLHVAGLRDFAGYRRLSNRYPKGRWFSKKISQGAK